MTTEATPTTEKDTHAVDMEAQLQEEVQDYLKEKERVRRVLGSVGGNPGRKEKMMNILFLVLVATVFIVGLFIQDPRILPLEVAILLVSLKLAMILTQNAKMSHFQFWMLSTIEWRLTKLTQDMAQLKKDVAKANGSQGEEKPPAKD
jgi:hypothetical protein